MHSSRHRRAKLDAREAIPAATMRSTVSLIRFRVSASALTLRVKIVVDAQHRIFFSAM